MREGLSNEEINKERVETKLLISHISNVIQAPPYIG